MIIDKVKWEEVKESIESQIELDEYITDITIKLRIKEKCESRIYIQVNISQYT